MKLRKILACSLLGLGSILTVVSCKDSDSDSTQVDVSGMTLTSINVGADNAKKEFYIGEEFSTEGLTVIGNFNDGTNYERVTLTDYQVDYSAFDSSKVGTYQISVVYQHGASVRTGRYTVTVKSILTELTTPYVKGITASGIKLDYDLNDELNTNGLVVTAVMSDGTTQDITNDTKLTKDYSSYDKTKKGNYELKFSYTDTYTSGSHSETRTVDTFLMAKVDATLVSIALNEGTATFTQYTVGDDGTTETVDTSTWNAIATYENGQTEIISSEDLVVDYTGSNFNSAVAGFYTVNLTYTWGDVTATEQELIEITDFIEPDYELNISGMENTTTTTTVAIEFDDAKQRPFTINAGIDIEENGKSYGAQYTFTKRLKLNRTGTQESSSIKIEVENATGAEIVVYAISSSSGEARPLGIYNSDADEIYAEEVGGSQLQRIVFTVDTAGTYYIYGTGGAVNLYYIEMRNND